MCRYAAQRKSRHDDAAAAAAAAIALAPHDHKMYAVRGTAAYKRRAWGAVVAEARACAKGLAAAQPSLLLKLAKGHGPSGLLRGKVVHQHSTHLYLQSGCISLFHMWPSFLLSPLL